VKSKSVIFVVLVILLGVISGALWYRVGKNRPVFDTSRGVPNILEHGNSDDAVKRGSVLISELSKNSWNPFKIKKYYLELPDQSMSDVSEVRKSDVSAWCIVPLDDPAISEVAIYTDLYVRRNLKVYKGDVGTANPEGFYIVGFRDGHIDKVPLSDVRIAVIKGQGRVMVFPGTKFYNKNLPRLHKAS
jgi:hypothetical protein